MGQLSLASVRLVFVNAVAAKRSRDISSRSIYIKLLSPDSVPPRIIRSVSVLVGAVTYTIPR